MRGEGAKHRGHDATNPTFVTLLSERSYDFFRTDIVSCTQRTEKYASFRPPPFSPCRFGGERRMPPYPCRLASWAILQSATVRATPTAIPCRNENNKVYAYLPYKIV